MDASRRTGLLAASALSLLVSAPAAAAAEDKPADLGLTESAQRRLVQVELVVDGPPERVAALVPADLDVTVGLKSIDDFYLDVGCAGSPAGAAGSDATTPASVALYFDQSHLTVAGRTRAYASAEVLAASLAAAGHRVRIVSNGPRLTRRTSWTTDSAVLDGALQALRKDMSTVQGTDTWERLELEKLLADAENLDRLEQWIPLCKGCPEQMFAFMEREVPVPSGSREPISGGSGADAVGRVRTVGGDRAFGSIEPEPKPVRSPFKEAVTVCLAHEFARLQRDAELWAADVVRGDQASFERLASFLIEMETVPGPKAVVLYAETLRRRGGQALLDAWRDSSAIRSLQARCPGRERVASLGYSVGGMVDHDATLFLDRVLQQASARRVRVHAVGEGLYDDTSAEAKRTLAGLALETGGRSFFGAATEAQTISQAVLRDATCPVVLSFDPDALPAGRLTSFAVKSRAEGVRIRAPGLVFSESPEQLRHSRWLAAALNAGSEPGDPPVFVGVIPLGREDGKFQTLVQVVAPPRAARTPRWDLGALAFDRDVAVEEESGSVTARPPGIPAVLEATMPVAAARPALVGIGLDTETDEVGAMRREDAWPDLRSARAGLSPLALVQPAQGGFVRDGKTRTSGTLTVRPDRGPDPQRPLGVLGLACRGRREQGQLVVERMLSGEKDYAFEPIVLDVPRDGCAQFRDTVPAGTLGDGDYRYQARIVAEGEELARQTVAFSVGAK